MQLTSSRILPGTNKRIDPANITLWLLCLLFLAGSVLGSMFGLPFSGLEPLLDSFLYFGGYEHQTVTTFIWFIRFCFISFLMGTTFLGVTLIPLLTFLRAYLLSCASASIISAFPQNGLVMALIIVGLPSLFCIPCYFAISSEAFGLSCRLLRLCAGVRDSKKTRPRAILFSIPVLLAGALAEARLIPYILTRIIR